MKLKLETKEGVIVQDGADLHRHNRSRPRLDLIPGRPTEVI